MTHLARKQGRLVAAVASRNGKERRSRERGGAKSSTSNSLTHSLTNSLTRSQPSADWQSRLCELELAFSELQRENIRLTAVAEHFQSGADRLLELVTAAPVSLLTLDRHGRILAANRATEQLLRCQKRSLLKRYLRQFVSPEDAPRLQQYLLRARRTNRSFTAELTLRGSDAAHPIVVQMTSVAHRDRHHRLIRFDIALADVTGHKKTEQNLRAKEDSFRALLEASPHAVQLKDTQGRWQLANSAALELFGLAGAEYRGQDYTHLATFAPFHSDTLAKLHALDLHIMAAGQMDRRDETIPQPDGPPRILDIIRVPIRDNSDAISGLVIVGYDITERHAQEQALRQNEERLRLILDTALDAVVSTDDQGIIIGWNAEAERMFGWPREQTIGRKLAETTIPPERRGDYEVEMQGYFDSGAVVPLKKRVETTALRSDGRIFPVEISVTSAMAGNEICFTAFIRDITERKTNERRLAGILAINRILARSATIAETIPKLLRAICESLNFELGTLWLPSDPTDQSGSPSTPDTRHSPLLRCHTVYHHPDAKLEAFAAARYDNTFNVDVGLAGRVWQTAAPVWIDDLAEDSDFPPAGLAAKDGLRVAFGFPILAGGNLLGVMEFFTRESRQPDEAIFGSVHGIGSQIGQFLERRRAEDTVHESEAQLRIARDQLADANRVLDERVHERTAELTAANTALQEEIRARAQAERARLRLGAIVESSSDAIASRSLDGTITSWNNAAERIFGWTAAEIVGQPCATLIPRANAEEIEEAVQRVTNGEMVESFETVALRKDGHVIDVSMTLSPVRDDEEIVSGISAIIRDISERKELQNEVLRVAEREQRRIAQDLHDGLGQQLAGISCLTNALKKDLAAQSSIEARTAARISTLLDSAVAQTRSLARGLLPVSTEPGGLMLALGQLAHHLTGVFKVRCHFDCPQPVEVADAALAAHFYRIAQEAATNSIKHGKARDIAIGLSASPERTILAVTDDGVGIRKTSSRSKGLGLRIMRHRAGVVGGSLIIQKRRGGGTEVICSVEKKGLNGNGKA